MKNQFIRTTWLVCLPLISCPIFADSLDFENLSDGTSVTNEYASQGLSFSHTVALSAGLSLNEIDYPPHSGQTVVADDGSAPITINFDKLTHIIGAWFTYTSPVTLTAFNGSGSLLGVANSTETSNLGSSTEILFGLDGVRRLQIAGLTNGSFVMDDLSFTTSLKTAIDTALPFYLASDLGAGIIPAFDGGTLRVDTTDTNNLDFTFDNQGGTLDANGHSVTFSGVFTDASLGVPGALRMTDSATGGMVILTGTNTYSGGTDLNGGVLSVASEANLGDVTGGLNFNGGLLQITGTAFKNTQRAIHWGAVGGGFDIADSSNVFNLSQVLSGTGSLTKQGAGTLVLSGANTYTGGTTVSNGVLQGDTSSLQGNIVNNAAVVFDQANVGSYISTMNGTGALVKQNSGTLTLTGNNTYSGGTTINQGTLAVDGSLASGVTVNTDGILRGTGVVNGNTSVAGRLAPGNSPGTLTVNGSVSMASSSKFKIDIDGTGTGNGAGNYSSVLVQGAGNVFTAAGDLQPVLRGITGNANNIFNPVIGQNFQVVTATGGVKGTFSSLTQPPEGLPTGTRFDALYDANAVRLAVTPRFYSDLPNIDLKGNPSAVGVVLDTVRPASFESKNSVFQALAIQSEPQVASTLQQMDGEIHADLLTASFNAHRLTRQAIFGRLSDIRLGRSTSMTGINAQNNESLVGQVANNAAQNLEAQANKNLWVRGMGGFASTNADRQASRFNESLYGVMLGSDYAITDNLQLGAAIGYVHNLVNANQVGNGTTDSIQFLGYGLWQRNTEFLNFAFGYGRDNYTSQRTVNLGGINSYKTNVDGDSGSLDVEAGTRRSIGNFTIEPSFGVRGDIISRGAFNEGGLVGLKANSTTLSAAQTRLGTKLSHGIDFGVNKRITPELRAYWLHDEGDSIASQAQATLLGQSLNITAANAGRDAASLGAGLTVEVGKNVALFADYNYEHRNAANGQNIFGGVRLNW